VWPQLRVVEELRKAAVFQLHPQGPLEKRGDASPGVCVLEGLGGHGGHLVEALLEQRVDDLFLVGEAPVGS
jgi:hypothetical protein